MTEIPHDAWVFVGDGEKALFLVNDGDDAQPNLRTFESLQQDNPQTHEQGTDRPGRFHDGPSPQRSAVEDTDWHEQQKREFARQLAQRLYEEAHNGRYQALIIVAPPDFLGNLRTELHDEVADRVIAEIGKNLTNHPVYEIEKVLGAS